MRLEEVYEYYDRKWCRIAISIGMTESSVRYWRKKGAIPFRSQILIEHYTSGELKADMAHSTPGRKHSKADAEKAQKEFSNDNRV